MALLVSLVDDDVSVSIAETVVTRQRFADLTRYELGGEFYGYRY
jgi:hypothetical protein